MTAHSHAAVQPRMPLSASARRRGPHRALAAPGVHRRSASKNRAAKQAVFPSFQVPGSAVAAKGNTGGCAPSQGVIHRQQSTEYLGAGKAALVVGHDKAQRIDQPGASCSRRWRSHQIRIASRQTGPWRYSAAAVDHLRGRLEVPQAKSRCSSSRQRQPRRRFTEDTGPLMPPPMTIRSQLRARPVQAVPARARRRSSPESSSILQSTPGVQALFRVEMLASFLARCPRRPSRNR